VATMAQMRTVLRGFWHLVRRHKLLSLGLFGMVLALGAAVWPHDQIWLRQLHFWPENEEKIARRISWYLGTWGDYPTYNLPLALAFWLYGVWRKSRTWRRLAVIALLGGTLAGLFDDFFRLTLGRPRPDAGVPDGFYGLAYAFQGKYESFPSGHAAAVFGTAAALLVTDWPVGIITTLFALSVVWARMELYRHYPSDVLVGSAIGIYFGLMTGWGAKARLPRDVKPAGRIPGS
jgi:membrane-associated phospholipid phosphatase